MSRFFARASASHTPPPIRQAPPVRDTSRTCRRDSIVPARPVSSAYIPSDSAATTRAVAPSSSTWLDWSPPGCTNWGMKAPKNSSIFGLLSATSRPCSTKPPRGGRTAPGSASASGARKSFQPIHTRYAAPARRSQSNQWPIASTTAARPTTSTPSISTRPICPPRMFSSPARVPWVRLLAMISVTDGPGMIATRMQAAM